MKILIILAHPDKASFNYAIAKTAVTTLQKNGHEVIFHDLYTEQFDPLLPHKEIPKDGNITPEVEQHCQELSQVEGIIIVHPNWWGQPPAILKGWVDRILRPGVAYEFEEDDSGEGIPIGLLQAKTALVFNTANTPVERELNVFGDPLQALWKNCIFDLCGVNTFARKMFTVIVTSTPEQRQCWLKEVESMVDKYFPQEEQR